MTKKLLLLTTIAVGVLALFAGSASAQYPDGPSASIDDTSVLAGGVVNITGQDCTDPDGVVDVTLGGEQIGTLPVADDGTFGGAVTIPADTAPGTYTLEAICGDDVLSIEITVSAAGVTPTGNTDDGSLARTGTSVDGLVKIGGGLLVAGAAATLIATKRRTASA